MKTPRPENRIFQGPFENDHSSAIADHVKTTDHIKWGHFGILASGKTD